MFLSNNTYKRYDNAYWMLIFYHNSSAGEFFLNEEEALFCHENHKFSILSHINDSYKFKGKFEYLLEYPELEGTNRWRQTNNPLFENENNSTYVEGYESVNISFTSNGWSGLAKSTSINTLLDGSRLHNQWYYAIGAYNVSFSGIGPWLPGPGMRVYICKLWIRVNPISTKRVNYFKRKSLLALTFL